MRLFIISKFSERERLRWLRDTILAPAGHAVVSTWIDLPSVTADALSPEEHKRQATVNRHDMQRADAAIYLPSWVPSPGRMTDIGLAHAFGKPIIVLGVARWADLGWFDRSIYLSDAAWCQHEADMPKILDAVAVHLTDGSWP